ncbi:MAG: ABC transporter permease [Lachnospiraceae bacterium]|nr:ABC transporter permease [Lachnospiraceae bacterium]
MRKKFQNITNKLPAIIAVLVLLLIWQICSFYELVPSFMLPAPTKVVMAFVDDRALLWENSMITLKEAVIGLCAGISVGVLAAMLMDRFKLIRKAFYPIVVITQTVPTVAIAPLLVLWFGYEMTPKIILIILATFFPITVGVLDGFQSVDRDSVRLLKSMGATKRQIFWHIKLPEAANPFFSGLRISVAYSIVAAVVSEWLGGFGGLGVYMTRVRKAYSFDKMFAVIFLISAISLMLIWATDKLQKIVMPYQYKK